MQAAVGAIRITPVIEDAQYERFLALPEEVYRDHAAWVAPDPRMEAAEVRGKTAFAKHCRLQPFIAEHGGRAVARVVALIDDWFNSHWQQQAGHLALFEALPEAEGAAVAMIGEACEWLRAQGCTFVRQGFMIGWTMPFTIDDYDHTPTVWHCYNPRYYHRIIKNAGFATEKGLVQYQADFSDSLADRYRRILDDAAASGIQLREWDFERMEQENQRFAELYNETFAGHWGAPQMSAEEWRGLTVELKDQLVPGALAWAEVDGQIAGGVYGLPDLNQTAKGHALDHGVLLTIGVRQPFRGRGVNLALGAKCFQGFIDRGFKKGSYTLVLDDNWPSRRTAEKLGCSVTHCFNAYRRELR